MGFFKDLNEMSKESIRVKMATMEIEYIGGHPRLKGGKKIKIIKGELPGEITITSGMLVNFKAKLLEYSWGEQGKRSIGKAATGAIVGGVLTGGIGAIAGAAIGGKKKDNSVLTIAIEEAGNQYNIQLRADQSKYNEFTKKVL
ncbi:hypothetical protein LIT32_26040 (plasmid) [Bacillus sp. CMF21]|nr:hypothetical protein LIT32_26040 [Bacillus sp. CMF21]